MLVTFHQFQRKMQVCWIVSCKSIWVIYFLESTCPFQWDDCGSFLKKYRKESETIMSWLLDYLLRLAYLIHTLKRSFDCFLSYWLDFAVMNGLHAPVFTIFSFVLFMLHCLNHLMWKHEGKTSGNFVVTEPEIFFFCKIFTGHLFLVLWMFPILLAILCCQTHICLKFQLKLLDPIIQISNINKVIYPLLLLR